MEREGWFGFELILVWGLVLGFWRLFQRGIALVVVVGGGGSRG